MKLQIILMLLEPLIRRAIKALRDKDDNSTGADDFAADTLETAIDAVLAYQGKG